MRVNDREFNDHVDELFMAVEDQLDEQEADVDIDSSGGVLTVTMEDGSSIVLSRQIASHEIWVAARSGGFHLQATDSGWVCSTTGEDINTLVARVFTEQLGEPVSFEL